jgi:serine/threonine protein kinase
MRERLAKLESLFDQARRRRTTERGKFLAQVQPTCDRNELAALLACDEGANASNFWALDAATETGENRNELAHGGERPQPEQLIEIGPYRVLHKLGEGGSSEVYCVELMGRDYSPRFAMKILKSCAQQAGLGPRFCQERRILAHFCHPNIARLIDGGTSPCGRLYFIMELVTGLPITEYCQAHALPLRERIEVICKTALVVEDVHEAGVLHRDLKPSNILVDKGKTIKILDFGVAKPSAECFFQVEALTQEIGVWMTPRYASPQQLRGEGADARCDVYALGMVAFEILNPVLGPSWMRSPWDARGASLNEASDEMPSTTALRRVIARACSYERDERHASAKAFAQDLQQAMLLPCRGAAVTNKARLKPARTLFFIALAFASAQAKPKLSETSVEPNAQDLRTAEDAKVRGDLADFRRQLDRVLRTGEGWSRPHDRADWGNLIDHFQRMIPWLVMPGSTSARVRAELFRDVASLAQRLGRAETVFELMAQALASFEEALAQQGADVDARVRTELQGEVVAVLLAWGEALCEVESTEEGLAMFGRAHALALEHFGAKDWRTLRAAYGLSLAEHALGVYNDDRALNRLMFVYHVQEQGGPKLGQHLADTLVLWGAIAQAREDYAASYESIVRALALRERGLGSEHPKTVRVRETLASWEADVGMLHDALRHFRECEQVLIRELGESHPQVASIWHSLGVVEHYRGNLQEAQRWARRALESRIASGGWESESTAASAHLLAMTLGHQGDRAMRDEANELHQKALSFRLDHFPADSLHVADSYYKIGLGHLWAANGAAAVQALQRSHEIHRINVDSGSVLLVRVETALAQAYLLVGECESGLAYAKSAYEGSLANKGAGYWRTRLAAWIAARIESAMSGGAASRELLATRRALARTLGTDDHVWMSVPAHTDRCEDGERVPWKRRRSR